MTDLRKENYDDYKVTPGALLIFGIILFPFACVWITLDEKFSKGTKVASFAWLALVTISLIALNLSR